MKQRSWLAFTLCAVGLQGGIISGCAASLMFP